MKRPTSLCLRVLFYTFISIFIYIPTTLTANHNFPLEQVANNLPDSLPWSRDATCNTILTDGIAAVTCGVLFAFPDEPYTFALIDIKNGLPASGAEETTDTNKVYHHPSWHVDSIGLTFGVALDLVGNAYITASANYGSGFRGAEVITRYGEIGGGSDDLNAAGSIYFIDGVSGQASVFTQLPQQAAMFMHQDCEAADTTFRTSGPGLGNIVFDEYHQQFFVSNFEDGRIYRIDMQGNILDAYDPFSLDDGLAGHPDFSELIYGLAIAPGGNRLFFGGFGASAAVSIHAIDLDANGGFAVAGVTVDNTTNTAEATWDNYVGIETLHSSLAGGILQQFTTVIGTDPLYMISDLTFDPNGNLLAGMRVGCFHNLFTSYNHGAINYLLSENPTTQLYDMPQGICTSYDSDSRGVDWSDSYGGVAFWELPDGSFQYIMSSSDILIEEGPHGLLLVDENDILDCPINRKGAIGYSSFASLDPKGMGGDLEVFGGCVCEVTAVIQSNGTLSCTNNNLSLDASSSTNAASYNWSTTDGNIVSGQNTAMPVIDASGTYQLIVTALGGCMDTALVSINADLSPPVAVIATPDTLNCTLQQIMLDASASSGVSSYQWTTVDGLIQNGANSATPTVSAIGTYEVVVTSTNGCTDTANVLVVRDENFPEVIITAQDTLDCQNTMIQLDGSRSTDVISYQWTTTDGNIVNGANTATPTVDMPGNYMLTITAANGCSATGDITIFNNIVPPTIAMLPPEILTCMNTSTQLDASISTNATTYNWTTVDGNIVSGPNTATPIVNSVGTYTLVISAANGCTAQMSVEVFEDITAPMAIIDPAAELSCSFSNVYLNASNSVNAVSYQWSTVDGFIVMGANTTTPLINDEGTYTLVVFAANGCTDTTSVIITNNTTMPTAVIATPDTLTCDIRQVTLDATTSSGGDSYFWMTMDGNIVSGPNTLMPVVNAAGTYNLVVMGANGCVDLEQIYVPENVEQPFAEAGASQTLTCTQSILQLDGSFSQNGVSYEWTTADGNIVSDAMTISPTIDAPGTYTLTVTAANGCRATDDVKINIDESMPSPAMAQPDILTCLVTQIQLDATASTNVVAYQWMTTDGNIVSGEMTATPIVDAAGTYNLIVTGANGCTNQMAMLVNEAVSLPTPIIEAAETLTCVTPFIRLNGSNSVDAISYQWTTLDGYIISDANTAAPLIGDEGTYTLNVTGANGCRNAATIEVMKDVEMPNAVIAEPATLTCIVRTITLDGTGSTVNADYLWTTTDGNIISGENTLMPMVNAAGTYVLNVMGINGCMDFEQVIVLEDVKQPFAEAGLDQILTCGMPTLQLDGNFSQNGVSYEWTTTDGNIVSDAMTISPTIDASGTYTLTVTAANGCMAIDDVKVTIDAAMPNPAMEQPDLLTCLVTQIQLDATASTNVATYEWTTVDGNIVSGATTATPIVDAAGTYNLIVTGANGCTNQMAMLVNEDISLPTPIIEAVQTLTCITPFIRLNGSNSIDAISYQWTTLDGYIISDANTAAPLIADEGTYTLTVTGANGCRSSATIEVMKDVEMPNAVIAEPATLTCIVRTITLDGTGSTVNADYLWTTTDGNIISGENTLMPMVNAAGTYVLNVMGINGCMDFEQVIVLEDVKQPFAEAGLDQILTCGMPTLQLDGSFSQNGVSYEWTTTDGNIVSDAMTISPTIDASGTYTLTVTAANGCMATDDVKVTLDAAMPNPAMEQPDLLTCLVTQIQLDATASTNVATYEWTTVDGNIVSGATTATPIVDAAGTYNLAVTGINGCLAQMSMVVNADIMLPTPIVESPPILTCVTNLIRLNGSNSVDAISYQWTTNDGYIIADANMAAPLIGAEGTYTLNVTGINGCKSSTTITVLKDITLPNAEIALPDTLTCSVREITLNGNGSTTNATYQWTTVDGNIVSGVESLNPIVNAPGTYILTVMGTNGCMSFAEVIVPQNTKLPFAEAGSNQILNCAQTTLQLDGRLSQNVAIYQWTTVDGNIVSGANTALPIIDAPGTYILTTTAANGCSSNDQVQISLDISTPSPAMAEPEMLTCLVTQIQLDATASTNVATYEWTTTNGNIVSGANTATPFVNQGGTYQLTITAPNGCTAAMSMEVNQATDLPTPIIATAPNLTCELSSIQLNGSQSLNAVSYQWTTSDGLIVSGASTAAPIINAAGTYTLIVRGINGCTNSAQISILEDIIAPIITITSPDTLTCTTTSISLNSITPNVNLTYQWTTTNGNIIGGVNTASAVVDAPGIYTLTATGVNGCTVFGEVYVPQNVKTPFANAGTYPVLNCNRTTMSLNGNLSQNAVSYFWTTDNGNIISGATTTMPTIDEAGTYQLMVVGENGCSAIDETTITKDEVPPIINMVSPGFLNCITTKIQLDASASENVVAYFWTTLDGNILNGAATATPTIDAAGTYQLVVTAENGCTAMMNVLVNEIIDPPTPNIALVGPLTCDLLSFNLNGGASMGAIAYQWFTADGNIVAGANSAAPLIDAAGTYTMVITGSNGCTSSASVTVERDMGLLDPMIILPDTLTCSTTQITIQAQVNATDATYLWSTIDGNIIGGLTSLEVIVDKPGTYEITVTGTNGCQSKEEVYVVGNFKTPIAHAGSSQELNCNQRSIILDAGLSQNAVSYTWTTTNGQIVAGHNTPNPIVTEAGDYRLLVVANNGCMDRDTLTITKDETLATPIIASPENITCLRPRVQLDATASSDVVAYKWTTLDGNILFGENTATPIVNSAGTYQLEVTAASGCKTLATVIVNANTSPSFVTREISICEGETLSFGSNNYQQAGTYENILVGINQFGCDSFATLILTVFPNPVVDLLDQTICLGEQVQVIASGGTNYKWTPVEGINNPNIPNPIFQPMVTTTYTLTVTDENGCVGQGEVTINVVDFYADAGEDITICDGTITQLSGQGTGTFEWSPANGLNDTEVATPIVAINQTTTYTLTTTTPEGCIATDEVTVFVNTTPTATVENIAPGCCNDDGRIMIHPSGGAGNYTYTWMPNVATTATATGLSAGTYIVIITDELGCEVSQTIQLVQDCLCSDIVEEEVLYAEDGVICLPIKPAHIHQYWMNAVVAGYWGCGSESQDMYSPLNFPDFGLKGPYSVDYWIVNQDTFSTEVENMSELVDWMNYIDPTADWAYTEMNRIVGGNPNNTYGDMRLIQLATWRKGIASPQKMTIEHSTKIAVDFAGNDSIILNIKNKNNCCVDSLIVRRGISTGSRVRPQLEFAAFSKQQTIQLQWATNTEKRNDYFEIQRSDDGENFVTIAELQSLHQTEDLEGYQLFDEYPMRGNNYYRIKQVYKNGTFDFTEVRLVNYLPLEDFQIFPNPAQHELFVNLGTANQNAILLIYNQFGQELWKENISPTTQTIHRIATKDLDNGFYWLKISRKGGRDVTKKFIINRLY